MHKVIRALEGVASDIKFTSAATHDSFMLAPKNFERGDLLALDRAYIDYGKFEELTKRGIVYVTKMKSGLSYEVVSDVMFMDQTKGMAMRIQNVTFTKKEKNGEIIVHHAHIVTYADEEKKKCVSLLTNDLELSTKIDHSGLQMVAVAKHLLFFSGQQYFFYTMKKNDETMR